MPDTVSDADTRGGVDRGAPARASRWQMVVGILGVLVVLWVGNDTYKVVDGDLGGGGHSPGRETPAEDENREPNGGGAHQPPAGGHG